MRLLNTARTTVILGSAILALGMTGCSADKTGKSASKSADAKGAHAMTNKIDKFSYANFEQVRMTHLSLNLDVNFDEKVLDGTATIDFTVVDPKAHILKLDTKDLTIKSVQGLDRSKTGSRWIST